LPLLGQIGNRLKAWEMNQRLLKSAPFATKAAVEVEDATAIIGFLFIGTLRWCEHPSAGCTATLESWTLINR
jgi:hypothetical protein